MRTIKEGNSKYCGPAVLSIITGKSTDETASILASIQGRTDVREVSVDDMEEACKKLRYKTELMPLTKDSSMFYSFYSLYDKPGTYMVFVKKHVVAIEVDDNKKIYLCDNHAKEPIDASNSSRLGQKCLGIYKVTAKPPAVLLNEEISLNNTSYGIYFYKSKVFEDPDDNVKMNLGYLTITDNKDIANIIKALTHLKSY